MFNSKKTRPFHTLGTWKRLSNVLLKKKKVLFNLQGVNKRGNVSRVHLWLLSFIHTPNVQNLAPQPHLSLVLSFLAPTHSTKQRSQVAETRVQRPIAARGAGTCEWNLGFHVLGVIKVHRMCNLTWKMNPSAGMAKPFPKERCWPWSALDNEGRIS